MTVISIVDKRQPYEYAQGMRENSETLVSAASQQPIMVPMRYECVIDGVLIAITRYDNHGHRFPDGGWVACRNREWYATSINGVWSWEYKSALRFDTPEQALVAAVKAAK